MINIREIWQGFIKEVQTNLDIMKPSFYDDKIIKTCQRSTLNKVITTESDLARKIASYIENYLKDKSDSMYTVHQELFVEKGNQHVDISIHKTNSIKVFCDKNSVIETAEVLIEVKYLPWKKPFLKINNSKDKPDSVEHDFRKLNEIGTKAQKYIVVFAEYLTREEKNKITNRICEMENTYQTVSRLSNF